MPDRTYNGPYAETEVHLPDGTVKTVAKGATESFPADACSSLDETGDWQAPKSTTKAADGGKE